MKHFIFLLLTLFALPATASLKIAVASNFKVTLDEIVLQYQLQRNPQLPKQRILVSSGSTGVLYNQIRHGAPFDLFLSADSQRAKLIEQSPLGVDNSRFTYARGALAFWLPSSDVVIDKRYLLNLKGRVAIANPKLAPYGLAAQQALQSLQLWSKLSYIQGNNISQTYQFIDTGNIKAGFVAHSLLLQNNATNYYLLPVDSYQPILQQGVILTKSQHKPEVQHFLDFLQSEAIAQLIRSKGYL
ncbi:molybdate ABC transporter substrate-binding protein [Psychromonas marina]|uniref:Molybdate ABC transporter substrate-binding protein n=1 Tax=Psychromonas marina TaxID=88364 RepID=A0ABQ6E2V5_9GAMM|nr:molybdate ABC transporter substrate-binding protein [Psychromonas marina]GLS91671.1 molybdate ABC transporter substrate-binding protein [Psychromonas marina]